VGSPFRCVVGRIRRGRLRLVPAIAFVRHQDQNWERPLGRRRSPRSVGPAIACASAGRRPPVFNLNGFALDQGPPPTAGLKWRSTLQLYLSCAFFVNNVVEDTTCRCRFLR
jgi:hypothetical protein